MPTSAEIEHRVRSYILQQVLTGAEASQLTNQTPLVTSGLLDSISTLRFVSFLEQELGVSIAAHETGADHFDTIERIVRLVASKLSS